MTITQAQGEINPIPIAAQKLLVPIEVVVFSKRCPQCAGALSFIRGLPRRTQPTYYICENSSCWLGVLPPPGERYPK